MARVLPDNPVGAISPEVARVHRLLKHLPDERFTVWQRLGPAAGPGPDFFVLEARGRAVLIKTAGLTPQDAGLAEQPALLDGLLGDRKAGAHLGEDERKALNAFLFAAGPDDDLWRELRAKVGLAVLLPNIKNAQVARAWQLEEGQRLAMAGKETLTPDRFLPWLDDHLGEPLSQDEIELLRRTFVPEVIIPAELAARRPPQRQTEARLTDYLLDYDQEWVLKVDLALPAEEQAAARDLSLCLVSGVPGSGKSLILIYRARLLRQLYPAKKILVLTHNKPLVGDLRGRYARLAGDDDAITWKTFNAWCYSLYPEHSWVKPIGRARRRALIERAWYEHLAQTNMSARMLEGEIDWYKDRLLWSQKDYLSADRTGRGFALSDGLRRRVWDALAAYQAALARTGERDWGDVPRLLWSAVEQGRLALPVYDFILVDEAQFFAPLWFELIKRALRPVHGQLFMTADPRQGFLRRRQTWAEAGLKAGNRALRLNRSYRTTEAILNFATLFYRDRLPVDDEDGIAPLLAGMPPGVLPKIIPLSSPQDEITRVVNEIAALLRMRVRPEHILVIHCNWDGQQKVIARLNAAFGPRMAVDPKQGPTSGCIRVCTLDSATGLESPMVFLLGTYELYEEEQSLRLSDDERIELIRDNTRKLYMAMTRTGQILTLSYVGDLPNGLQRVLASAMDLPAQEDE